VNANRAEPADVVTAISAPSLHERPGERGALETEGARGSLKNHRSRITCEGKTEAAHGLLPMATLCRSARSVRLCADSHYGRTSCSTPARAQVSQDAALRLLPLGARLARVLTRRRPPAPGQRTAQRRLASRIALTMSMPGSASARRTPGFGVRVRPRRWNLCPERCTGPRRPLPVTRMCEIVLACSWLKLPNRA